MVAQAEHEVLERGERRLADDVVLGVFVRRVLLVSEGSEEAQPVLLVLEVREGRVEERRLSFGQVPNALRSVRVMTSQLLPERMERDESSGSAIKCSSSEENPKRKVRSRTRSRSCTLVRASRKEKNVIGAPQSPKSSPLKTSRQDVSLAHMSAPKAGTTVEDSTRRRDGISHAL